MPRATSPTRGPDGKAERSHDDAGPKCRYCWTVPAEDAEFRRNTGLILLWKSEIDPGPYCRQCGIAAFRSTTNHSLKAGWWGVFAVVGNLYAIARKLVNRNKILKMHPIEGADPAREGPPMFRRGGVYVAAAGAALFCFTFFVGVTTSRSGLQEGDCVRLTSEQIQQVSCSLAHDGKVTALITPNGTEVCPPGTDEVLMLERDNDSLLCVDFDL